MKLISLNIEFNKHLDLVLPFLERERPDVLCLQEMLEEDFLKFKQATGLEGIFRPWSYILTSYHADLNGQKQGVAIFAKNIADSGFAFYVGSGENVAKPFPEYASSEEFRKNKVLVWADVIDAKGKQLRFATTHFPVTKEGASTPEQLAALDALCPILDTLGEFVLCGDLNAPRGNETFARLAKRYKDNIPEEYATSLDQNLHRVRGLIYMVDALFTTPSYAASEVRLADGVSDHMAIVAHIEKSAV